MMHHDDSQNGDNGTQKSIISSTQTFLGIWDAAVKEDVLDQHVHNECVEKFSGRMMWDGEGFYKRSFSVVFLGRKM